MRIPLGYTSSRCLPVSPMNAGNSGIGPDTHRPSFCPFAPPYAFSPSAWPLRGTRMQTSTPKALGRARCYGYSLRASVGWGMIASFHIATIFAAAQVWNRRSGGKSSRRSSSSWNRQSANPPHKAIAIAPPHDRCAIGGSSQRGWRCGKSY